MLGENRPFEMPTGRLWITRQKWTRVTIEKWREYIKIIHKLLDITKDIA
jgi:hypothetical protein